MPIWAGMKPSHHLVLRVLSKKRKAADRGEGPSRRQHRSPSRSPPRTLTPTPPVRTPAGQQQPRTEGVVDPVDLTADTPPEGPQVEMPPAAAPPLPEMVPVHPDAEPVVEASLPVGQAREEPAPAVSVRESSAPDAAPSAPAWTEAGEGGMLEAIPSRPSLMNHGCLAERIMAQTHRPDFRRELHRQEANSFFWDMAVAQLWMSNSVAVMREVLAQAESSLSQTQKEAAEFRARAEEAEAALGIARACEDELGRVKVQLEAAMSNVLARDASLDTLSAELRAAEEWALSAEKQARELDGALAEEKVARQAAKERASMVEERATAAEKRATTAEGRATAAEERAATAVEEYKKSSAFAEEVIEASAEVYLYGFRDGKAKVGRIHGLSGLEDIEPDEAPEEPTASPRPADGEAGPGDA